MLWPLIGNCLKAEGEHESYQDEYQALHGAFLYSEYTKKPV